MCVCVCVCVYVYILRVCMCMCVYVCVCVCTCVYMCVRALIFCWSIVVYTRPGQRVQILSVGESDTLCNDLPGPGHDTAKVSGSGE